MHRSSRLSVELVFVFAVDDEGGGEEGGLGGSWMDGFGLMVMESVGAKVMPATTDSEVIFLMVLDW